MNQSWHARTAASKLVTTMDDVLSPRSVARVFAVLYVPWGVLIALEHLLAPGPLAGQRAAAASVGLATALLGAAVWFLPWQRLPRRASLGLLPAVFALGALDNYLRGNEPYAYAIFFILGFAWTGLAHPPGTSLRFSPLFAAVYAAPLLAAGRLSLSTVIPLVYPALACLLVGETLAWTSAGIRRMKKLVDRAQEAVRQRDGRFRSLVQNSWDVITVVGVDGMIQYQSVSLERVLGHPTTQFLGARLEEFVHPEEATRVLEFFQQLLRIPGSTASIECRVRHRNGSWRHCETTGANLLNDKNVGAVVLNTRDVTDHKLLEQKLTYQAFHDPLTRLANRPLFADRVQHALAQGQRVGARLAVLFIDLDGFKTINDSLGHATGDQLLVNAAERLRSCIRPGDTAARLGGDEFAILLEDVLVPADATSVAERILDTLPQPMALQGKEVVIRASIGIAIGACCLENADDLLRNADVAMYVAKANGKDSYVVFQPEMHAEVLARLELEADLRRALDRGEFTIHYQPTVALPTGRIVGLEALVRWRHPERGLLHPADFVSVAEESGLILPLGRWVLQEACRQARSWQERYPESRPLMLNVNLSARQLQQPDVVDEIAGVLQESGLDPRSLVLEITETVLMNDTEGTIGKLERLKELGALLAIDDFGTGYSSLNYIRRFKIDMLKIDKSFIQDAGGGDNAEDPALARAVVKIAHSLRLQTFAEGIETAEQLALVRALQCDFGQGHYFAGPLEAEVVEALLRRAGLEEDWEAGLLAG